MRIGFHVLFQSSHPSLFDSRSYDSGGAKEKFKILVVHVGVHPYELRGKGTRED